MILNVLNVKLVTDGIKLKESVKTIIVHHHKKMNVRIVKLATRNLKIVNTALIVNANKVIFFQMDFVL